MVGSATLTTVPSRNAMPDPSTVVATTQRPAFVPARSGQRGRLVQACVRLGRGLAERCGRLAEGAPQVEQRVRPPWSPALGQARRRARVARLALPLEGVTHAQVGRQEHVGVAGGPQADVGAPSRARCQGALGAARRARARSADGLITSSPAASAAARVRRALRREAGIGRSSSVAVASAAGVGNRCVSPPSGEGSRSPSCATRRRVVVRAPATETCWPRTARTASSAPSTCPGDAPPRTGRHQRGQQRVRGEGGVDHGRVGVEVEQPSGRARVRPARRADR